MMQMLAAGGLEPMTDGQRVPDENNPRGFFEWEEIKQLPKNPHLLSQAVGKAVKIVTPLLPHLPRVHRYKIVVMRRPIEEIVRSQLEMLRRAGQPPATDPAALASKQLEGLEKILALLRSSDRVELLEIDYPALVADPAPACNRLAEFLGSKILPHPEKMPAAIEAGLHRQRG
jgi:hypothetical protein